MKRPKEWPDSPKKVLVASEYALTVDKEILQKILDKDDEACDNDVDALYEQLLIFDGVSDVEYDAHFGPQIYVHIDPSSDTAETWDKIYQVIDDYIKETE